MKYSHREEDDKMNEIKDYTEKVFDNIKHINEFGNEYWYARELQKVLEYVQWRRFEDVIKKAKLACLNSCFKVDEHFANVGKKIKLCKNGIRDVDDYKLSRYACYLIAQNGDPRKEVIASAQTYFAVQTRKQELFEKEYNELTEAKLKRDNVDNEYTADSVHFEVGREVRNSIERLGGTMPEALPTPSKSLKEIK